MLFPRSRSTVMAPRKNTPPSQSSAPQPESEDSVEGGTRPTFYMSPELLAAINQQCIVESDKKRSPFVAEILSLLLMSPTGQKLKEHARKSHRSLLHELESNLVLFHEQIPTERIIELAEASQRNPDQMMVRLVLLGLRVYERAIAQMETEIEQSKPIP